MSLCIFQWCEVLSLCFSLTYTSCHVITSASVLDLPMEPGDAEPCAVIFHKKWPQSKWNHFIIHQRSDTVFLLHISPQVSFYLHGLCYPVALPWFYLSRCPFASESNLTFDWLASAVVKPCFPFLCYLYNQLIHFIIPSLIPSNLYFILWLIFLKFEFQRTISCSQYFYDSVCLWEAKALLCAPRALAPVRSLAFSSVPV